jgi:transcriptional regulator with XRE-family HTH domain
MPGRPKRPINPLVDQIERYRLAVNKKRETTAREAGLSPRMVEQWVFMGVVPTVENLNAYARALGWELTFKKLPTKEEK